MRAGKRKMVLEDEGNVLQKGRERMDTVWNEYDQLWVSFSGGKDSGGVLSMAFDAWERNGPFRGPDGEQAPINIMFFDDEFAYPETERYVRKVIENNPERVHYWWFALPIKYSLGVASHEDYDRNYWQPWNPEREGEWIREHPRHNDLTDRENVTLLTQDHPLLKRFKDGWKHKHVASNVIGQKATQNTIQLVGVRAAESLNRHTAILSHGGWLHNAKTRWEGTSKKVMPEDETRAFDIGYPIYDWKDTDLWAIHEQEGWDYNKAYDKLHRLGYAPRDMRTAHPFNYMSIRAGAANTQRQYWSEDYEHWFQRHSGAEIAFEYGNEAVGPMKPDEKTWEEYAALLLNNVEDEQRKDELVDIINNKLEKHFSKTNSALPQAGTCDLCGDSWRQICDMLYEDVYGLLPGQV